MEVQQEGGGPLEDKLHDPPTDGVTAIRFAHDNAAAALGLPLLVSSWDSTLSLYDAAANARRACLTLPAPVLDCDFVADTSLVASGCLDGAVRLHHLESGGETLLGRQESAVRCVRHFASSCLVSGSWDKTVKVWDARGSDACVATLRVKDKVLSLCTGVPSSAPQAGMSLLVVATAGREVSLFDLRKPTEAVQARESSLKCQTRCVAQMPGGEGYTVGSVEGRVAVEYVDPSPESQARKYAFKCHRLHVGGVDTPFPVNTIAFHPQHATFATGGCDGHVYVWDGLKKKRVCSLRRYPTSIAALAFSQNGDALAVAASYTYENGDVAHPSDQVYIRRVLETEVKPKSSRAAL